MTTTEETASAPPAARKQTVLYDITDKGVITRHDTKIAHSQPVGIAQLTDGKVTWASADLARMQSIVSAMLKYRGITAEFVPYVERPPVVRDAVLVSNDGGPPPAAATDNPDGPDGMRSLTVEQRKAVNLLRSKEGYPLGELERPIPPAPAKTSGAGDKTPEYVRWLLRYQPAKFVKVYGVDRVGSIEITVPGKVNPSTGMRAPATREWEPGHVLARRATIFTKVVRNRNPADKEEDYDAS